MSSSEPSVARVVDMLAALPVGQMVLLGFCAATWLIGGNVVISLHYRRIGKHWASGLKPFAFPFKDFNAKEWVLLLIVFVIAMLFGIACIAYG